MVCSKNRYARFISFDIPDLSEAGIYSSEKEKKMLACKTDRQRDKQTDRQIDRQTDQTDREIQTQTHTERERLIDRQTDR